MTAFLLSCYMNSVLSGSIHFRSAVDCTFYSEELSGQKFDTPTGTKEYNCICQLVPNIDPDKVRVY